MKNLARCQPESIISMWKYQCTPCIHSHSANIIIVTHTGYNRGSMFTGVTNSAYCEICGAYITEKIFIKSFDRHINICQGCKGNYTRMVTDDVRIEVKHKGKRKYITEITYEELKCIDRVCMMKGLPRANKIRITDSRDNIHELERCALGVFHVGIHRNKWFPLDLVESCFDDKIQHLQNEISKWNSLKDLLPKYQNKYQGRFVLMVNRKKLNDTQFRFR